jgi:ssDNA-binding Zn-finger/Zn-ribbon topoisomerase 1
MIDEVTAKRKTREEASRQFNQMLTIQGVSVNEAAAAKASKKKFSHLRLGDDTPAEKMVKRPTVIPVKPVNIFSQLKTDKVIKPSPTVKDTPQPPAVIVSTATPEISGASPGMDKGQAVQNLPETAIPAKDFTPVKNVPETGMPPHEDDHPDTVSEDFEPLDDKEIEDRILEFEAQLGLKCPLCGTGSIKTSETAKGKTYYHCSDSGCTFISWGKPYYIDCPKCASNFLIEVTDSSGKSFLKCPKATCAHWQKFPWEMSETDTGVTASASDSGGVNAPKKLVRRRRVVRRKR